MRHDRCRGCSPEGAGSRPGPAGGETSSARAVRTSQRIPGGHVLRPDGPRPAVRSGVPLPAGQQWATMTSRPKRTALAALVLAEVGLTTLTWRDLRRRPADQIRGSKRFWRVISTITPGNSVAY